MTFLLQSHSNNINRRDTKLFSVPYQKIYDRKMRKILSDEVTQRLFSYHESLSFCFFFPVSFERPAAFSRKACENNKLWFR